MAVKYAQAPFIGTAPLYKIPLKYGGFASPNPVTYGVAGPVTQPGVRRAGTFAVPVLVGGVPRIAAFRTS